MLARRPATVAACLILFAAACSDRDGEDGPGSPEGYYVACAAGDCGGTAACFGISWEFGAGDVCSRTCEDETSCPSPAGRSVRCLDVEGEGEFLCHVSCASDA